MRIIYSFVIIMTSVFLFLLPLTDMVYEFRTDAVTERFYIDTSGGLSTDNVTLDNFVYDDDDNTINLESTIMETPVMYSYNSTSKTVWVIGLTANTTRYLDVTYDIDAISDNDAVNNLLDKVAWIWMLINIAWPMVAIGAIWSGREGR